MFNILKPNAEMMRWLPLAILATVFILIVASTPMQMEDQLSNDWPTETKVKEMDVNIGKTDVLLDPLEKTMKGYAYGELLNQDAYAVSYTHLRAHET